MKARSTICFLLANVFFRMTFARSGMIGDETDGELPPLKDEGVKRVPEDGVVNYEDLKGGKSIECKLDEEDSGGESSNGKDKVVKDTEWKWVQYEINEDEEEDKEIPFDGEVNSKLNADILQDTADKLEGWFKVKCSSGDSFAEFRIDAGNVTKAPKLPFRVKPFDKSKVVVEKEDFRVFCEIVNRTKLTNDGTIQEGLDKMKEELNVRWYRWTEADDHSYAPEVTDPPQKPNCTEYVFKNDLFYSFLDTV